MARSSRLFELIQMLRRAKRPVTADWLAMELGVTPRTIYRDVAALQAMRVPVEGAAGLGYVMRKGYDLPPVMFSAAEVEAIIVGLALLRRTGDRGLIKAAGGVARKLTDVVPASAGQSILQDALLSSAWGAKLPPDIDMEAVREAVRESRKLALVYQDGTGSRSSRVVLPIAIIYFVESVLLAAWCELRNDFRHFRIDRIHALTPLDTFFNDQSETLRARWRQRENTAQRLGEGRKGLPGESAVAIKP